MCCPPLEGTWLAAELTRWWHGQAGGPREARESQTGPGGKSPPWWAMGGSEVGAVVRFLEKLRGLKEEDGGYSSLWLGWLGGAF